MARKCGDYRHVFSAMNRTGQETKWTFNLFKPSGVKWIHFKVSGPHWSNQCFLIFWHSGTLALRTERQSARVSKNYKGWVRPVWCWTLRYAHFATIRTSVELKGLMRFGVGYRHLSPPASLLSRWVPNRSTKEQGESPECVTTDIPRWWWLDGFITCLQGQ